MAEEAEGTSPHDLSITQFLVRGATSEGVGLRVHVSAAGREHSGEIRVPSLEHITPGVFVGTTLLAAERVLDTLPVDDRSSRILILEPVDVEVMDLRRGPKVAVTVRAILRDGEILATGITSVTKGVGLRVAAARAALEAVQRIRERRDAGSAGGREDDDDLREGPRTIRGFMSGGGSRRDEESRGGNPNHPDRGQGGTGLAGWHTADQDPFYSWD